MIEKLLLSLELLHWTETGAVLFGIIYIILAARESVWCWFWGILSTALWAYAAYAIYQLYIDALLQLYYVFISFFGIYQWLGGGKAKQELKIQLLSIRQHLFIISTGLLISVVTAYFFRTYTQAAATGLDAFTTVFSIITTYMVTKKYLSNWIYWLVINSVYIYLYAHRGSLLFTILFMIYLIISIAGFLNWKRNYKIQKLQEA